MRPVHASTRLRLRQLPASRLQQRVLSYSSIPRAIGRACRIPIGVVVVGVGVYWYINYKLEQLRKGTIGWAQETATTITASASDGIKSVSAHVSALKPPNIEMPKIFKDLTQVASDESTRRQIEELGKKTSEWLQGAGKNVVNAVSVSASTVKLSNIEAPKFLRDLFSSDSVAGRDSGKPKSDK